MSWQAWVLLGVRLMQKRIEWLEWERDQWRDRAEAMQRESLKELLIKIRAERERLER